MRQLLLLLIGLTSGLYAPAQAAPPLAYFPLKAVKLLPSPFEHAQTLDKAYLLELEADRLLAPYLREAGLPAPAESYPNWENTGLDGHIGGHYVSALSMMYAATGDSAIGARLDYMLAAWQRCQEAHGNGYLGGVPGSRALWDQIARGDIQAGAFDLNGRWVPLYNLHKVFAGLRDAYLHADRAEAKTMLIALTDWAADLTEDLGEAQIQDMLRSEHGGINEVFAEVAALTGEARYLQLARKWSHRALLDPLLAHQDELTGQHANTQIPKVIGYQRVAEVGASEAWMDAARFFWETVVKERSVVIGGNSAYEHFHPKNNFSRMIHADQGPETCNTYNMLRLTQQLFRQTPQVHYLDYYERALYNHILASQHPETGGLVYFTQMRPGHYRVYSQPHTSFWCCVGSGIENHAKYGEMIYAHTEEALYVNLFLPSRLDWAEKGVEVVQENEFPDQARTQLTFHPDQPTRFALKLRHPGWVEAGSIEVWVNGQPYPGSKDESGFVTIDRTWKQGDEVQVSLPMRLAVEPLPDGSPYYAFRYGPIVLAAKFGDGELPGLFADTSRGGHIAPGEVIPLHELPVIVSEPEALLAKLSPVPGRPLTFRLQGLAPAAYAAGMELMPFFRLHEARYLLYWPQATEADLARRQEEMARLEQASRALDAVTLDKVACGEQQPESDHFVQAEGTWTGFAIEEHYREGPGWFAYQLKNPGKAARFLFLKHFAFEPNRAAEVSINGQVIETITIAAAQGEAPQTITLPIPASLQNAAILDLKVTAQAARWMPKIVEVRLLSEPVPEPGRR